MWRKYRQSQFGFTQRKAEYGERREFATSAFPASLRPLREISIRIIRTN
jgi:hypothetical protein